MKLEACGWAGRLSGDGIIGFSAHGAAKRPFSYIGRAGRCVGGGIIGLALRKHTTRPSDAHEMTASISIGVSGVGMFRPAPSGVGAAEDADELLWLGAGSPKMDSYVSLGLVLSPEEVLD